MNRKLLRRMTLPLIAACLVLADCSNNNSSGTGPTTAFAVLRLTTASGSPDTSFAGGRGITITDIDPGLFDFAIAATVQPADNKILAAGSSGLAGQGSVAMVRYNPDGSLDTGFGAGGIVRTTLPGVAATASAIAVQPADNKILVAAVTFTASTSTTGIAILRYNPTGTLDTAGFGGGNGYVIATIGPGLAGDTCALALQGTNIIVAGASTNQNLVLHRYDTNGNLDATFGPGGTTTTPLATAALSPAIAFQSTGNIILVSGTNVDQVVLRYSANGILDTTFGTNGIVTTDIGTSTNFANALAVQSDDKIVVAGHANVNTSTGTSDISLVRYNADGTLDATFVGPSGNPNPPGIVTTDLSGGFDNAFSVALQTPLAAATNILVSGNTGSGGISQMAVLRYNTDGTLDTTFGPNASGVVIVSLVGPSNIASGNAVVLQTNLGIIVAGYD